METLDQTNTKPDLNDGGQKDPAPVVLSREAVEAASKKKGNVKADEKEALTNFMAVMPDLMTLAGRVAALELKLAQAEEPQRPQLPPRDLMPFQGINATMVGGIFNCPECGLRIVGPSMTAVQGSKGAFYEHPFEESPKLNNQKCRLIGVKFKSPIVQLEFVNPAGLTAAK